MVHEWFIVVDHGRSPWQRPTAEPHEVTTSVMSMALTPLLAAAADVGAKRRTESPVTFPWKFHGNGMELGVFWMEILSEKLGFFVEVLSFTGIF